MADLAFPANIVASLTETFQSAEGISTVLGRPLRPVDPNAAVGIYAVEWTPGPYGIGQHDPFDAMYLVNVQVLIKHMNEEEARAEHSVLAKYLRAMVYRDPATRLRLAALSESSMGIVERVQKWHVRAQRFLSNEIQGEFLFLSTMELVVTVETV